MAKIKFEVEVNVPEEDWIEFVTSSRDIFQQNYCGYWLRGIKQDSELGWLVWEDDENHLYGDEPNRQEAIRAWQLSKDLPERWFRLDREAAIKAYIAGCKRSGINWFTNPDVDANSYDVAIQLALLGEHRYG